MRFGIRRRLRRGARITIYPTLRCSMDCHYCSQKTYNGAEPPSENEMTLNEWKEHITALEKYIPIQHATITGGEPFIVRWTPELINWLLDRGILVSAYTNLSSKVSFGVNNSPRYRIITTYHHQSDKKKYLTNLLRHAERFYLINVEEIGHSNIQDSEKKIFEDFSNVSFRVKPIEPLDNDSGGMTNRFTIAPDGSMFVDQEKMHRHLNAMHNPGAFLKGSYSERLERRKELLKNNVDKDE